MFRELGHVFFGLVRDAAESVAFGLGLDHAGGFAVDKKQVIARPAGQREFAHGDAGAGIAIERIAVLQNPSCRFEQPVDLFPCLGFRCGQGAPLSRLYPCWTSKPYFAVTGEIPASVQMNFETGRR